uniref:Cyclophilin TM1367-like domain-containing protein n=1 Tax=Candidatus Methanomethylicus mesodigestus TaxID=1867258 RepID=A0A7C3J523_9CREN
MPAAQNLEKYAISISFKDHLDAKGELVRVMAPRTVDAVVSALPFTSRTSLWKEEIYFVTPVQAGPEKPKQTVKKGDIAFWPPGNAFCIFYGESQPYSPVNVIGRVTSDIEQLRCVNKGEWVSVSLMD